MEEGYAQAEQAVAAIDALSDGPHEGHRAAHAKGTLLTGTFTATPAAAELTTAPHMQGEPVRATVRLSNGGGKPTAHDGGRDGRGIAVKLYLPDGSTTDMVMLNLPAFFVRTPEEFLEFTNARRPDPETGQPDFEVLGAFLAEHPEAQPVIQAALSAEPLESYAGVTFNALHAFRWTAPDGTTRYVRYTLEPVAELPTLSDDDARARDRNYLQQEILERAASGGAAWRLVVQIAADDDSVDDPTQVWPDDRERVEVGRLELTGPETEREQGDDVLVFDPTRTCEGIEPSDDQILNFRPRAYSVSVERRSGAPRLPL